MCRNFIGYEGNRTRYVAGLANFENTIDDALNNIDNISKIINSVTPIDCDFLVDNLIKTCFFQFDKNDLLNIVSIMNHRKYRRSTLIKTTMSNVDNFGITRMINYEIGYINSFYRDDMHYYSPQELGILIKNKKIVLIREKLSEQVNCNINNVHFPTVISSNHHEDLFCGFYDDFEYYKNNMSNQAQLALREYIAKSVTKEEIILMIHNYIKYVLYDVNILINNFGRKNETSEFANLCKQKLVDGDKIKKLIMAKNNYINIKR